MALHIYNYSNNERAGETQTMNWQSNRINILHVDDEPEFADLAARLLENEDDRFSIEKTTSAEDGLEEISDCLPDCIISDYNMPGMNGIDFLRQVRESHPQLPFILYTGRGSEEVASEAISAGVTDYLQKGHQSSLYTVLANRITNAVKRYESDKQRERWRQAVEAATDGVGIISADGQYVQLNDAYAFVFNASKADLVGTNWREWYPPEEVQRFEEEILPQLRKEGKWRGRAVGRRTDGTRCKQALSLSLLDDGGHTCMLEEQNND